MGIGNLESTLRTYAGAGPDQPIAEVVADRDLSYARLYFDSTPLLHRRTYAKLAAFGDDSSTYLWRLLAARQIMRLYRQRPAELRRLAALHAASDSAERVLHPRAIRNGRLVEPPDNLDSFGLVFDRVARTQRAMQPETLSAALYIGAGSKDISGQGPLAVTAAATGYEFDVARRYRSDRQAAAFQFLLDRLQALNLIAWRRDATRIHVVAAKDAEELLPPPPKLLALRR